MTVEEIKEIPAPQDAKMVPESEIDRIRQETAHKSFQAGFEKGKSSAQPSVQAVQSQASDSMGGNQASPAQPMDMQQAVAQELEKILSQQKAEQERLAQEQYGKQVLHSIHEKANKAKAEIPDFDEVTSQVDFGKLPDMLGLADTVENGGHVLYDLAKNPSKIGSLRGLPPELQLREIKRLSESLKTNQDAQNIKLPQAPLSQLSTSGVGVSTGEPSFKDLRKKYRV